jgi:hypothetical protein
VRRRQWLAVHLVGQQGVGAERILERDRAAEPEQLALLLAAVETREGDVPGLRVHSGREQDVAQADAAPDRVAGRPGAPGDLSRDRGDRRQLAPPVSRTRERRARPDAREAPPQLAQLERQWRAHEPVDREPDEGSTSGTGPWFRT